MIGSQFETGMEWKLKNFRPINGIEIIEKVKWNFIKFIYGFLLFEQKRVDLDKIWLHFWNKRRKTLILDPSNVEKVKNFNFPLFSWEFLDFKFDRFDFKSEKWSFLTKFFCFKSQKKVAHQISYGSRSLLNFLRANWRQKISPISKVRTFGFELLTKTKDPGLCVRGKNSKNFFVWFRKKWHFWNRLGELISKMSFFFKLDEKIFSCFKDPGLWFLSKVQNQRYGPLKRGKFFCSDLPAKNSADYLNHKKFDEQLFLGIWSKKFWPKKTIFWISSQIWNLRILTKKVENSDFWLFQRLRGLNLSFFVADFKNEVRFCLSPTIFGEKPKIHFP